MTKKLFALTTSITSAAASIVTITRKHLPNWFTWKFSSMSFM